MEECKDCAFHKEKEEAMEQKIMVMEEQLKKKDEKILEMKVEIKGAKSEIRLDK